MRSLLAAILGAIVIALVAYLVTLVIDHTALPNWLDVVAWVVALIVFIVWLFPGTFSGPRRTV